MAACGGLQLVFDKPLPEKPTLLKSLSSWNQIKSPKPIEDSSFTEIFGELHFKENPESLPSSALPLSSSSSSLSSSSSSSSSSLIYLTPQARGEKLDKDKTQSSNNNEGSIKNQSSDYFSSSHKEQYAGSHKYSDSFSSMNSESLQLCTEGLGFESSDDVEDLKAEMSNDCQNQEHRISITKHTPHENLAGEFRRSRSSGGTFPPPISSIGKSGRPWVCFKSYRHDGRFVLKEIRIPTQEFLHARREDGRLKLQFLQSDDEILEEKEEEEEEENEEYDGDCDGDDTDDHDSDTIRTKEEENSAAENMQLNSNGEGGDS